LPDALAEKAATVLDAAAGALGLLDTVTQDFIETKTDLSVDDLVALTAVVRDEQLARHELEDAQALYRDGKYVDAYRSVKNSLILMQTSVDELQKLGADVKPVQRAIDATLKALP
jgi:hypothetical protein